MIYPRIDLLEPLIERSVRIKNEIVLEDPFEANRRKLLNFGHTVGHAIETYSMENQSNGLLHGEAVAIGIICEAFLSVELLDLDESVLEEVAAFIFERYPSFKIDPMAHHRIIEIMRNDKKNVGDKMNFTLIEELGEAQFDHEVSADRVIDALNYYQVRLNAVAHEA